MDNIDHAYNVRFQFKHQFEDCQNKGLLSDPSSSCIKEGQGVWIIYKIFGTVFWGKQVFKVWGLFIIL